MVNGAMGDLTIDSGHEQRGFLLVVLCFRDRYVC